MVPPVIVRSAILCDTNYVGRAMNLAQRAVIHVPVVDHVNTARNPKDSRPCSRKRRFRSRAADDTPHRRMKKKVWGAFQPETPKYPATAVRRGGRQPVLRANPYYAVPNNRSPASPRPGTMSVRSYWSPSIGVTLYGGFGPPPRPCVGRVSLVSYSRTSVLAIRRTPLF